MLLTLILLLAVSAVAADWLYDRRRMRCGDRRCRIAFIVWAAATDLLPVAVGLGGVLLRDNGTGFMYFAMWALFGWMVTVLPRMVFYFFGLLHLRRLGIAAGALLVLLFVWGATKGRTSIRVEREEIVSPRVPAAFDGFRIVQLSDIHLGTMVDPERELTRIVDSVEALRPDLVAFCGDLVNIRSSELDERVRRLLGRLDAPYGVVSVLGNHDVGVYIKDTLAQSPEASRAAVVAAQRAMGWTVLDDESRILTRGGDSISISGISFDPELRKRRHDADLPQADLETVYRGVPDGLFNLTLVHLPQLWPQVAAAGYGDLTLSGHVHAMQTAVRLFGRRWSPAQLLYERWSSRYDEDGRTLYVNDGTGCVAYPMRLGADPEITLLVLRHTAGERSK